MHDERDIAPQKRLNPAFSKKVPGSGENCLLAITKRDKQADCRLERLNSQPRRVIAGPTWVFFMATIDRTRMFPQVVMDVFVESWPGFGEVSDEDRRHLVMLLCSAFKQGKYSHHIYADCISYSCRVRDKHFGRGGFYRINDKLNLFRIEDWYLVGSHTKGYGLTPEALYLLESLPLRTTELMDTDGVKMKIPARDAILQRDANGNNRKGTGQLSAIVPVQIDTMIALLEEARGWRWHFKDRCAPPAGRRLEPRLMSMADDRQRLDWLTSYLIVPLSLTILRADTAVLPKGQMEIQYLESTAGRLYAVGGIMQNAPKEVRNAAFAGCFDYDVKNCHYDIVRQLAARIGMETPAIEDYLARKSEVRHQIAADIGVSIKQIKEALISIIYGATMRCNSFYQNGREVQPAIVRMMGKGKAAALFKHPAYLALHQEVKRVRKPILDKAPKNRDKIISPFGKGISTKESAESRLAHVVQGVEALILDCVIRHHHQNLRLLMHDGFISAVRLDTLQLAATIQNETGFTVSLEETALL